MKRSALQAVVRLLPEPAMVVEFDGALVVCNGEARRLLGEADNLVDAASVPEQMREQLRMWSGTTASLPGSFCRLDDPDNPVRADGGRLDGTDWVFVRVRPRPDAHRGFASLNEKLDQLRGEIDRRVYVETSLAAQMRVLEMIARGQPLASTLEAITRLTETRSSPGALSSILLVVDGQLRHGAAPSLPPAYSARLDGVEIGPRVGACGTAAYRGEAVVAVDIQTDPLWDDFRSLAAEFGLRACWSTPVLSSTGEVIATVANYHRVPWTPTSQDREAISMARGLTTIAIERERTLEQLHDKADALTEMNRRKNEFLAMLGHELRNPLSSIAITLELLRERSVTEVDLREPVDLMQRKLALVRRLVDDLLDVSRVTQGKVELRRRPLDLRTLVDRAVASHRTADDRVHADITTDDVWVDGDAERLQQVLDNLLHNARKFTPLDGTISVAFWVESGTAVVEVVDDGLGIEPHDLPYVFELFAQDDRALDRAQGGLGIGLTLVRSLVERHGGSVVAHSDGRGRGARLVVRLPTIDAGVARARATTVPIPVAAEAPAASLDVLVVDDDHDAAELLSLLLTQWGHRARVGHCADDAFAAVQARRPDVVVLDIGLPGMDGFQIAERLRERQVDCTLVALTGYGREADNARALEAGFDAFLVKPLEAERLRRLLQSRA